MTREEKQKAIYVLKNSAPVFPLKKPEEYNDYIQTIKQVIDWLEQEPFINKPCVSSEVCEHDKQKALDKIRAEIESMDFDFGDYYDHTNEIIEMVCKAIDKYKAKAEPQESEVNE